MQNIAMAGNTNNQQAPRQMQNNMKGNNQPPFGYQAQQQQHNMQRQNTAGQYNNGYDNRSGYNQHDRQPYQGRNQSYGQSNNNNRQQNRNFNDQQHSFGNPQQSFGHQQQSFGNQRNCSNNDNQRNHIVRPPFSNTTKIYPNKKYCHTHGFDVNHDSSNCLYPGPNHVWPATQNNTCNRSVANSHKVINNNFNHYSPSILNSSNNMQLQNNKYYHLLNEPGKIKFDSTKIERPKDDKDRIKNYGMLDSGTTSHFIAVRADVKKYNSYEK